MRKTSLYIEDDVDAALTRRAQAEGIAKAELIRRALTEAARPAPVPRISGIGSIKGAPRDLASDDERHLAESGFGEG